MIPRELENKITEMAKLFPIVSVTGPRQAGKTTLVKHVFANKAYVSLEDPDIRLIALDDPRAFLRRYSNGAILDEVQRVPDLFSYLQSIVDQSEKMGQFILSGSQSFLLQHKISQSLAGRMAVLKLLPLSISELKRTGIQVNVLEKLIFHGGYPRIYDMNMNPLDFFPAYVQTYIERDVRTLKNVQHLDSFTRFLKLCAGRIGQVLNISSLANDCGISVNTAKAWFSVLEASYIIFFLQPHHANFNKRLIKMPKLYFYDTGLVCYLLGLERRNQLETFYLRGEIFENFILSELIKFRLNKGLQPNIYFWRNSKGVEIDCLVEKFDRLIPIEIKSGLTPSLHYFDQLKKWNKISGTDPGKNLVVYAGETTYKFKEGTLLSWREFSDWLILLNS